MSRKDSKLKENIKKIPKYPGIYIMKGKGGKIIYVGKAKNLNNRVRDYFSKSAVVDSKTASLMKKLRDIDYVTTDSEIEALVLECNFIKEYRPLYNIKLKDDKKYPYIKLTMTDTFPRIMVVRNIEKDDSVYFGPYTDTRSLRRTLSIIGDIFTLRRCSNRKLKRKTDRECLYYQIGKCSAPCTGKITEEEYMKLVEQVKLFLNGRNKKLLSELQDEMRKLSAEKEYERAAVLRDQMRAVKKISEKQLAFDPLGSDEDIVALSGDGDYYCAVVMKIREGKILNSETFMLPSTGENKISLVTESFIKLYYDAVMDIPPSIYIRNYIPEGELLAKWLSKKAGRMVKIKIPKRGRKNKILQLAEKNAELKLFKSPKVLSDRENVLEETKKTLGLYHTPFIIEGYDISNIQGTMAVGSMVVFHRGKSHKKGYRHFKIKTVKGSDDFAMIAEVLARRFEQAGRSKDTEIPDLILIDGGKGQVSAAMGSLKGAGLGNIPVIGLTKQNEEIHKYGEKGLIKLPSQSIVLKLLQQIRNEAHRFAIDYHRKLRLKSIRSSRLNEINGIGEKRKIMLLNAFGSVKKLSEASIDDIADIPGIGIRIAKKIYHGIKE
ncbi:MAG: excinuclease ABC subunit UvrC [Candidatus Krumholzibacteriota bacterium]|nr:excinuclease ABC subunit UvrC [Candidatus Krumholzibacteriota bacterium]